MSFWRRFDWDRVMIKRCSRSLDGWALRREKTLGWARMTSYVSERGFMCLGSLH